MIFSPLNKPLRQVESTVYNQIFFTNVLRLLDTHGLTKNQLADASGISVSFLSDLTNGKANPSLKIMEAIAITLHTPLPVLLEHTDLDKEALRELIKGTTLLTLPDGYVRVSSILTKQQADTVQQWDDINQKVLNARNAI